MVCDDFYFESGCDSAGPSNEMKTALNEDQDIYLNMYYTDCASFGLFGFATFPIGLGGDSVQGVVNGYNTITGGDMCGTAPCEGDTAVHEVGHYLGLYHTFQGGCSETNDQVSDTPAVSGPKYGSCGNPNNPSDDPAVIEAYCTDTCEDLPGCDMQWNFMDYVDDHCTPCV